MAYKTQRRVEFRDTDSASIMHFSCFFVWMEQAEHAALRSLGMSVMEWHDSEKISWPRVSAKCDYLGPARFEDVVDIVVSITNLGSKSVQYEFQLSVGERRIANGELTVVCCRIGSDKIESIEIPNAIRQKLTTLCVGKE